MTDFHIARATRPLIGSVQCPGDKSISHRAAILAALAEGDTRIENFLESDTTAATRECLRALGADLEQDAGGALVVHGRGLHSLRESNDVLFCRGSGTTLRLLAGVCAGQGFLSILDCTPALKRRPMGRLVQPLRSMGATVLARAGGTLAPLALHGGNLRAIEHTLPVASAQVKSALLLAALYADAATTVREPGPSRDHTERMLRACGIKLAREGAAVRICPAERLVIPNSVIKIPADFSSAAFLLIAALLVPGSTLRLENVGINPTRTGLLEGLEEMGANIALENTHEESGEPVADLIVSASAALRGTTLAGDHIPRMIDEFPILAVVATQAHGETVVRDAQELRAKESDRIAALVKELRRMGAHIEEHTDGFLVAGPTPLHGTRVSAHNDHRLAMSLAVAGLVATGETTVEGWECIADSFPDFGQTLQGLVGMR